MACGGDGGSDEVGGDADSHAGSIGGGSVVDVQPAGQAIASVDGQEFALEVSPALDCIIADDSISPSRIADEMVAQAEHDPMACVVAVLLDSSLAREVQRELVMRLADVPRADIARQALGASGAILVAGSAAEAIDFANEYAPEHLLLALRDADQALAGIRNAGTVFIGAASSVAFGDYMTGANHVLPTGGSARWSSGLSPLDFVRWTTYQRIDPTAATSLAADAALLAQLEDLPNHARAACSAGGTT